MYSILSLFTTLQQKFTYRQRFIFFALVFFIVIPYPTYWLLHTQNAMLQMARLQEGGIAMQRSLSALLYESISFLTKLTIAPDTADEAQLSAVQRSMSEYMRQIKTFSKNPAPSLLTGEIPPTFSDLSSLYHEVDLFIALKKPHEAVAPLKAIIYIICQQTRFLAMDTALFFNTTTHVGWLPPITYEILPQDLLALTMLLSTQENEQKDNPAPVQERTWSALDILRTNSKLLMSLFHAALQTIYIDDITVDDYGDAKQLFQHYHKSIKDLIDSAGYKDHDDSIEEALFTYHILQAMKYNQQLRQQNIRLSEIQLHAERNSISHRRTLVLALLGTMAFIITLFVIFRLLTRHLTSIQEHIDALAEGDFTPRPYPQADDAFALVGLTLNDMATSLSDISSKIHRLGLILADSSEYLTYDIRNHELSLKEQEKNIASSETTAQIINDNCRIHANIISELSSKAIQQPLTQRTHEALDLMQDSLTRLATNSHMTLLTLHEVETSVQHAMLVCEPFREVSEQAHLLALSSAIEQNHTSALKETAKITRSIQRFSSATAEALHMILDLFYGTSQEIKISKETISNSLEDINQGTIRLRQVNNELSFITQQARRQLSKFDELHNVMQIEAVESESIIDAIRQLQKNSNELIEMFNSLSVRVQHLGIAAQQLKTLLRSFGRYLEY